MAETFGGKAIVTFSLIGSGVINILTPLVASSTGLLVISRMFLGIIQGGIFPSCYAMIGKWFPLKERSLGFAFMEIGATIGSVLATTSAGYLSEHGFAGGWPSVFYVSGILSLASFFAWYWLTESTPGVYEGITSEELNYIQSGGEQTLDKHQSSDSTSTGAQASSSSPNERENKSSVSSARVPWVRIFTSAPVLAIITSKFCMGWCFFTLLTKLPAYLHDVLHVSPTQV
jgi:ACS family sodium-dependent inorganic phosphate cotransporter-like MFS transporter 5